MPRFRKLTPAEVAALAPAASDTRAETARAYDEHLAGFAAGDVGRGEVRDGARRDMVRQQLQAAARRRGLALRFRSGPGPLTFRVEAAPAPLTRPAPRPAAGAEQRRGDAVRRDAAPPRPPRRHQTVVERYQQMLPRWMREGQPPGRRTDSKRRAR